MTFYEIIGFALATIAAAIGVSEASGNPVVSRIIQNTNKSVTGNTATVTVRAKDPDAEDIDALARTLWGEARGDGYRGMQAVANVVMNRFAQAQRSTAKARQFGSTVYDIVTKPYQFSVWNARDPNFSKIQAVTTQDANFRLALEIATDAVKGRLPDITGGADHYHADYVSPTWSQGVEPIAQVNSHKFFKLA